MAKKKKKIPLNDAQSAGFGGTFGDLLKKKMPELDAASVDGTEEDSRGAESEENVTHEPVDLKKSPKIILRRERKGRGGKTVTLVEGIVGTPAQLEALAKEMRKGLGCGSTLEENTIVLQGDMTERAHQWLEKRGAKRLYSAN